MSCSALFAQEQRREGDRPGWHERMKAEKIAYLTEKLELTPQEAERFWPVYNENQKVKWESSRKAMEAYKKLGDAVKAEKNGKELASLLDSYLSLAAAGKDLDAKAAKAYRKVLPEEKVAKLFIFEESFRKQLLRRLQTRSREERMKRPERHQSIQGKPQA